MKAPKAKKPKPKQSLAEAILAMVNGQLPRVQHRKPILRYR